MHTKSFQETITSPSGKTEAPETGQIITSMAGLGSRVKTDVFFLKKVTGVFSFIEHLWEP